MIAVSLLAVAAAAAEPPEPPCDARISALEAKHEQELKEVRAELKWLKGWMEEQKQVLKDLKDSAASPKQPGPAAGATVGATGKVVEARGRRLGGETYVTVLLSGRPSSRQWRRSKA